MRCSLQNPESSRTTIGTQTLGLSTPCKTLTSISLLHSDRHTQALGVVQLYDAHLSSQRLPEGQRGMTDRDLPTDRLGSSPEALCM